MKVYAETQKTVFASGTAQGKAEERTIVMSSIVQRFSISHGLNLLLVDAVARQDFIRRPGERLGRLMLTARLGLGGTIPYVESDILGVPDQHYQTGPLALQLAGGMQYRIWRGLSWLAEYKFTRTRQDAGVPNGTMSGLFLTHHFVSGFSYFF